MAIASSISGSHHSIEPNWHTHISQVFFEESSPAEAQRAWSDFQQRLRWGIWTLVGFPDHVWETSIDLARQLRPNSRRSHPGFAARCLRAGVEGGAILDLRRPAGPPGRGSGTRYQRLTLPIQPPKKSLLRSDDSAQRMTARQNDAAMIDLLRRGRTLGVFNGQAGTLDQCPAASRAPVGGGLFGEHGVAMAANAFHTQKLTGWNCRTSIAGIAPELVA